MAEGANAGSGGEGENRRDFLILATGAVTAVGTAIAAWPFMASLKPSADVLALATIEVDLSAIEEGQAITVMWRGKPVFIRYRTAEEITEAEAVPIEELRHAETDADRVLEPQWLVMVGVCTHLGCIPKGQAAGEAKGEYGGWFCPCHGSHYDTSGRIRKGPAPTNLPVPEYQFVDDTTIRIG
jgi:ubiquinol-cytochrome c reductase iron-sulfur subunit